MKAKTPYRRLQERVKELEKQLEEKRIDEGGWVSK